MKRFCCDGLCAQGRDCPVVDERRPPMSRADAWVAVAIGALSAAVSIAIVVALAGVVLGWLS